MSEKMTVYHGTGRLSKCDFDELKPDYRGANMDCNQKRTSRTVCSTERKRCSSDL